MKYQLGLFSVVLSFLATAQAEADYLSFQRVAGSKDASAVAFSREGVAAIVPYGSSTSVVVVGHHLTKKEITDRSYFPLSVNDSGDVVGGKFDAGTEGLTDYAFYTPYGGTTSLLLTTDELVGMAINNAGLVVTLEKTRATFYQGTSLLGSVVLGAEQFFVSAGSTVLRESGELIAQIDEYGTRRFIRVTLAGGLSFISTTSLPAAASVQRVEADDKLLILSQGRVYRTDLSSPPVPIGEKTLINSSPSGMQIYGNDLNRRSSALYPRGILVNDGRKRNTTALECLFRKNLSVSRLTALYTAPNGEIVAEAMNSNYSSYLTLLAPTGGAFKSYCPVVTAKIIGACAPKFKLKNGALHAARGSIPKGTRCEAEVTVREELTGKPIKGRKIVSASYYGYSEVPRGVTDSAGKVRFKFKIDGETDLTVRAPVRDSVYRTSEISITAN